MGPAAPLPHKRQENHGQDERRPDGERGAVGGVRPEPEHDLACHARRQHPTLLPSVDDNGRQLPP